MTSTNQDFQFEIITKDTQPVFRKDTGEQIHYHHCPKCYQKAKCKQDCSIEPDLEDPVSHPDKQFGSHAVCDDCTPPTQEWFDKYNGLI